MKTGYRRHRGFYSFRAWIDTHGSNEDRYHEKDCLVRRHICTHLRLWDLNWSKDSGNIIRVVRRRRPLAFSIRVGRRMCGFSIGMSR